MKETKDCQYECPFCGSQNIEYQGNNITDTIESNDCYCTDCEELFTEVYELKYLHTHFIKGEQQ